MKTASHTPMPWKTAEGSHGNYVSVVDSNGKTIARIPWGGNDGGNADMIVRACNSHDALVSALNRAVSQLKFLQSQHADAWAEDEEKDVMDTFEQGKKALSLANS